MLQLRCKADEVWAFHTTAQSEHISCILYWFYSPAGTQSYSRCTSQQGVQSDIPCTAAAPETAPRRGSAGGIWCRRCSLPYRPRLLLSLLCVSLEKCLFTFIAHFGFGCLGFLLLSFRSSLYILDINPLSDI